MKIRFILFLIAMALSFSACVSSQPERFLSIERDSSGNLKKVREIKADNWAGQNSFSPSAGVGQALNDEVAIKQRKIIPK